MAELYKKGRSKSRLFFAPVAGLPSAGELAAKESTEDRFIELLVSEGKTKQDVGQDSVRILVDKKGSFV